MSRSNLLSNWEIILINILTANMQFAPNMNILTSLIPQPIFADFFLRTTGKLLTRSTSNVSWTSLLQAMLTSDIAVSKLSLRALLRNFESWNRELTAEGTPVLFLWSIIDEDLLWPWWRYLLVLLFGRTITWIIHHAM